MKNLSSPRENPRTQRTPYGRCIRMGVASVRAASVGALRATPLLAYLTLLITLALAPLAAHADMPPSQTGDRYHGVDFAALTNPANKVYYGQYKHYRGGSSLPQLYETQALPVLWRTMGEEASDGKLSLFSEYVLDTYTFHGSSTNGSNYYPSSAIYTWLNTTFNNNIFAKPEGDGLDQPTVTTSMYNIITGSQITGTPTIGGYTYTASLPWQNYALVYLPWAYYASATANVGLYWTASNNAPSGRFGASNEENKGTLKSGTAAAYWTRTPSYASSTQAVSVTNTGGLTTSDATNSMGVRPVVKIDPTRILFASEIKTSANTANGETEADGTNYAAPASGAKYFKLTVFNDALTVGTVTAGGETLPNAGTALTKTVAPGSTVVVTASGATDGTFLTCKIVNSSGAIVGYGQGSNNSLTVNAKNLSGGNLAVGNYTVYVWAQQNNDKISHEGSYPKIFTLKVAPDKAETPNIGTQPTGTSYVQNTTATPLTVKATVSDGGTLSYQWYRNTTISTSNGSSLNTPNGAQTDSYTPSTGTVGTMYYYCIVTNTNSNAINRTATSTSSSVAITVNKRVDAATPVIETQPQNASYVQGTTATALTVKATVSDGGTLSYQWFRNTTNSTTGGNSLGTSNGARTDSYTPPTTTEGTIWYYCVVTNTNNSVNGTTTATATSNTAEVIVNTGLYVNGGNLLTTVTDVKSAITSALQSDATATVTGELSGVTETLDIVIPAGKTVVWQANLEGTPQTLVTIFGGGTLDVAAGGLLKTSSSEGSTVFVDRNTTLKVSGGTVEATGSYAKAIELNGVSAKAEVTGGFVKAVNIGIECKNGGIVSVSGGTVSASSSGGRAIDVYGASTVEISGAATVTNTATAGYAINISNGSTAVVSIKGGTVEGYNDISGGTVHISGGTVYKPNGNAINLYYSGNAVITGGEITGSTDTPIYRSTASHTGAAYYTGDHAGLFNANFTANTNLFKLDGAPALTANGGTYIYSSTTQSAHPVVATLSDKLDLTDATVTASAGNPTVNTTTNTVTFDKTVNSDAITIEVTGAKIAGTNIDFTTAAFGVNTTDAGLSVNGAGQYKTVAEIETAITNALKTSNVTVTGALSGVTEDMSFTIPAGKTVVWQADYSGSNMVTVNGSGTFEINGGGKITSSVNGFTLSSSSGTSIIVGAGGAVVHTGSGGYAIYVNRSASLTVDGGTVSSSQGSAIIANGDAAVTVKSGTVENNSNSSYAIALSGNATLAIEDGTVKKTGSPTTNVVLISDNSTVFVSGGTIVAGGIHRAASAESATGYYTGNRAGLFNANFTANTNLFKLDGAPALTANGVAYAYDNTTQSADPVVATLSNKLDLTDATVTASAGNPTVNTTTNTVTFDKTVNSDAITIEVTGAKIAGTNIPVSFTTADFGVNVAAEGLCVNGGKLLATPTTIAAAIHTALAEPNATVTVTGALSGVTEDMTIDIPDGRTVVWQADYSADEVLSIIGSGTFEIANGGKITSTSSGYGVSVLDDVSVLVGAGGIVENTHDYGIAISISFNVSLTVDGGTVRAKDNKAIEAYGDGGASVTVKSGTVESSCTLSDATIALGGSTLAITGGTVQNTGTATDAVFIQDASTVLVSGGTIAAGGIRRNANAESATGYYTGSNAAAFDQYQFTPGTDLFQLDEFTLNATYNSATPSNVPVVATLSDKLDLTNATVTASAGNPAVNKAANTVTFNQPVNNPAITIEVAGAKIAGTNIPVSFTTAAFGVNVDAPTTYGVSIATFSNGSVSADKANYEEDETVTLTITPDAGYELEAIEAYKTNDESVKVPIKDLEDFKDLNVLNALTGNFPMPAFGVTITATFKETADQTAILSAKAAIEGMTPTVAQATANGPSSVRIWLAAQINALTALSGKGITVSAGNITTGNDFIAAIEGNVSKPEGANGSFTFTVLLQKGSSATVTTASRNGVITATVLLPAPTADDLNFTIPTNHVYNGTAQGIGAVTAGKAGMGTVTVYYEGSSTNYPRNTVAPTNPGYYVVTADITDGTNYTAATDVLLDTYIIGKATVPDVQRELIFPVNFAYNMDIPLSQFLPALTSPMSFGTIEYRLGYVENTDGVLGTVSYTSGNTLTLPILSVSEANKTATVNITVFSDNFNDFTSTVTVNTAPTIPLSVTGLTVQAKTYDGTAAASLQGTAQLSGVPAGYDVSLSGAPSAAFDNKNAGTNKPVTISGLSLTGEYAPWFHLDLSGFTGAISQKSLTNSMITAISNSTYNGTAQTPALTVTDGNLGTLALNTDYEKVTYSNNKNAGTASASITGKGNYTGTANANFVIAPATLTATNATLADKTYDGTTDATVSGVTFSGLQNGETLTLGTDFTAEAVYFSAEAGANAATVTVTLSNTEKAKNYVLNGNGMILGNQPIGKATTSGVNQTQGVDRNHAQNVDFNLAVLLPQPESPKWFGIVTYNPVITANADGVLAALSYISGSTLALPVQSVSEAGKTATVTVTVSSENYADFTATITVRTELSQDDADIATAKSLIESANLATEQPNAPTQEAAKAIVQQGLMNILIQNDVEATINGGTFTAATAGTPSNPNGTDGSYTFTVRLSKGNSTPQTTATLTLKIIATPYDATQDNNAIEVAKDVIENDIYEDTQANIPDAAAAKAKMETLIAANLSGLDVTSTVVPGVFTPAIAGTPADMDGTDGSYTFTVKLNKGGGTEQTTATLTLTVIATPYDPTQDNDDILTARDLVENATYTDTQANIPDAAAAIAKVNAVISGLALNGVSATVAGGTFTPATAGTANNPAGTNGSYVFTVNLNKGGGTEETTGQLTLTITATPSATHTVNITATTNGTVSANPTNPVAEKATVTLTVSPASGYELNAISAHKTGDENTSVALNGTGNTRIFTMPAYNVTVNATFKKTADLLSAEAAKTAIEGMNNVTVAQAMANTEADVKTWLATQINALTGMNATGITVSAANIALSNFKAAQTGTASNLPGTNGSFTFTVSLQKGNNATVTTASKTGVITATAYTVPTYAVTIGATTGGTVIANPTSATAGTTVTVTVTPDAGYELDAIIAHKTGDESVVVPLNATFEMPAFAVTITATFKKTQAQQDKEAVETAKAAIEGGTYRVAQATGNDAASVRTWLVGTLNVLFGQSHGVQFRSTSADPILGDVTVTAITPAIAGTEALPNGTDGSFAFTVSLERGATTLTATVSTGVIVAIPHVSTPVKRIELLLINDLTARIINTGNVATGDLTLTLSGTNADAFTLPQETVNSLNTGSEANIAITPRTALAVGTYTATLTVSGEGLTPVSVEIVYTVKPTGIDSPQATALKAYVQNGTLHVSGLTVGEMWGIYSISGTLIYQSVAREDTADRGLSVRGVYVVKSGNETVKVMY